MTSKKKEGKSWVEERMEMGIYPSIVSCLQAVTSPDLEEGKRLSMKTCTSVASLRSIRQAWIEGAGGSPVRVGFVLILDEVHEGHVPMLEQARRENDRVILSVYANPERMSLDHGYEYSYVNFIDDLKIPHQAGIDLAFLPTKEGLYANHYPPRIRLDDQSESVLGADYPHTFDGSGLATIVFTLCQLIQPHSLYFERNDVQSSAVIERMVKDFHVPVHMIGVPLAREEDGLVCGLGNGALTSAARRKASQFHSILATALYKGLYDHPMDMDPGDLSTARDIEEFCTIELETELRIPNLHIEYVALRTYPELRVPENLSIRPLVCFAEIWIDSEYNSTYLNESVYLNEGVWVTQEGLIK